jgi:mannose-1-phosphate guanylyltransferase
VAPSPLLSPPLSPSPTLPLDPDAAGPLAVARAHLDDGSGEPFFVFNSDVTCDYPLQDLLDFHRSHPGAEGTLLITMVQDPSKYGVVAHDEAGLVTAFVEKPTTLMWGNHINAGLYCLSPAILRRIPLAPTSIEKEVFPFVADEKKLFCMRLKGYWMDIGQPKDYVTGVNLHLAYLRSQGSAELAPAGEGIRGNVLIHPTARVAPGALLGPDVVVGPGCTVEQGARLQHSTLLAGSTVRAHAYVDLSIVGWKSTVGMWGRVEGNTVLGEDVQVGDGVLVNGALVLPHKTVRESIHAKGQIIM